MVVVCDASPLIILAKLDRLDLLAGRNWIEVPSVRLEAAGNPVV